MDQLGQVDRRLHRELFPGHVGVGDGSAAKLRGPGRSDDRGFLPRGPVAKFLGRDQGRGVGRRISKRLLRLIVRRRRKSFLRVRVGS